MTYPTYPGALSPSRGRLRRAVAAMGVLATVALVAGCSTSPTGSTADVGSPSKSFPTSLWKVDEPAGAKPSTPRRIGFINNLGGSALSGPFQAALAAGAKAANMSVITTSPNGATTQAIQQLKQLQQRGVSGIYDTTIAPEMTAPNLAAMKQGAMVVQWNQGPATSMLSSLQYDGGYRVGEYVAKYVKEKLGGKATIAWLSEDFNESLKPRTQGFNDAVKKAGISDLVVAEVTPPGDSLASQSSGITLTNTLLQKYPALNVVAGASDDLALGAATALKTAGRSASATMTVGIDGTAPGLDAIQKGDSSFKATVAVNFPFVAYLPGRLFGRWADGLTIPQYQVFNYALIDSAASAAQLAKDSSLAELPNVYARMLKGDNRYVTPLGTISYATRGQYFDGTVPQKLPTLDFTPKN